MRRALKAGLLFLIFITAIIYCQSAQEEWQTKEIRVKPANIKVLLRYRGSGLTYFDYTDKEYKELLNVIKLFYTDKDSEHYLGEITRTGVYDAKGNAVYVLPENLKGSYISSRNLSFPTSANYVRYQDGKYIEMDTAVALEIDLKTMTVKKYEIILE